MEDSEDNDDTMYFTIAISSSEKLVLWIVKMMDQVKKIQKAISPEC